MADEREQNPIDKDAGTKDTEKSTFKDLPDRDSQNTEDVKGGRSPRPESKNVEEM